MLIVDLPESPYAGKTSDQIIVELLDSLGRLRALTDGESRLLERVIRRGGSSRSAWRFWTADEDKLLHCLKAKGMTAIDMAATMDRTPESVRWRIKVLKRQQCVGKR